MSFAASPAAALRAAPRAPSQRRRESLRVPSLRRRGGLSVRASVHEDEPREGLGRYLARAAASLFAVPDDHGVRFPLQPYEGHKLRAKDRARLARFEQVVNTARHTLDAMPADTPAGAEPRQHRDIGACDVRTFSACGHSPTRRPLARGGGCYCFHKA